jgi:hypothetical protein
MIKPKDIVRITGDNRYHDCLAVVEEVSNERMKCYVYVPGKKGSRKMSIRLISTEASATKVGRLPKDRWLGKLQ